MASPAPTVLTTETLGLHVRTTSFADTNIAPSDRLPNLTLPEQPEAPMGRFAQLRAKYLKENRKVLYYNLLTSCKLNEHLTEVEQTATELTERLTKELQEKEGVTESLKATDMMSWVRQMNNIRSRVQETVLKQVVYA